jgi:hypothetical protein
MLAIPSRARFERARRKLGEVTRVESTKVAGPGDRAFAYTLFAGMRVAREARQISGSQIHGVREGSVLSFGTRWVDCGDAYLARTGERDRGVRGPRAPRVRRAGASAPAQGRKCHYECGKRTQSLHGSADEELDGFRGDQRRTAPSARCPSPISLDLQTFPHRVPPDRANHARGGARTVPRCLRPSVARRPPVARRRALCQQEDLPRPPSPLLAPRRRLDAWGRPTRAVRGRAVLSRGRRFEPRRCRWRAYATSRRPTLALPPRERLSRCPPRVSLSRPRALADEVWSVLLGAGQQR